MCIRDSSKTTTTAPTTTNEPAPTTKAPEVVETSGTATTPATTTTATTTATTKAGTADGVDNTTTPTYTPPAWLQPSSYEEQALDVIGKISLWVTALAAAISSLMVVVGAVPGLKENLKQLTGKK